MIIHLIASPRNVSTALMYSIGQHSHIFPVDEPFYATYLHQSETDHPGKTLILQKQPVDRDEVFAEIRELEERYGTVFLKNMAHHIAPTDLAEMKEWNHVFLIRHPRLHIHSFAKVIFQPNLEALGTNRQRFWYDHLKSENHRISIMDANRLLDDPEKHLRQLCHFAGIEFQQAMLSWPAGPKTFDGCWAPHWYQNAWKSTQFGLPKDPESVQLPGHLQPLYETCMIDYQYLYSQIKS